MYDKKKTTYDHRRQLATQCWYACRMNYTQEQYMEDIRCCSKVSGMICPFNRELTLIASIGARQRHGTDDHELPGRGTMQGIDGLQGPFPLGYAFHFPVLARQSQIYRPIKNSWLEGKYSWK